MELLTDSDINKFFADYLDYDVREVDNTLFIYRNNEKISPWMPNFDLNQLYEIKRKIEVNDCIISLYGSFFEVVQNKKLLFAHNDRSPERALYKGLYLFLNRKQK